MNPSAFDSRKITLVVFGFGIVVSITFSALSPQSHGEELKRATPEAIAKYQEIFAKLEKDYATIHGKAVLKQERFNEAKPRFKLWVHPFEFARIPGMMRVDQLGTETTGFHDEVMRKGPKGVVGYNATRFFYVIGPKDDGSYTLQRTEGLTKRNMSQPSESMLHLEDCPYRAYELRLSEMLADSRWKVYEPTEFDSDGRKLIRLRMGVSEEGVTVSTATKGSQACCVTVLLDPELNHAVCAWSSAVTSNKMKNLKSLNSVTIEYQKDPNGRAIPKTLTEDFFYGADDAPKQQLAGGEEVRAIRQGRNVLTIERFDFEAKPAEYFELKAFGLPDILPTLPRPGDPAPQPILKRR